MQGDRERMSRAFARILQTTMLGVLPVTVGLAFAARDVVYVMLGAQWLPCAPYLQVLCISGALYPLHLLNLNVVLAVGRSDIHLRLEIIKKVLIAVSILATYRYGVIGLLWGQVACSAACLVLNTRYAGLFLRYGLLSQAGSLWKIGAGSLAMGLGVLAVGQMGTELAWVRLCIQIAVGGCIFLGSEWFLKDAAFLDCCDGVAAKVRSARMG